MVVSENLKPMTGNELRAVLAGFVGETVLRKALAGNTLFLWFRPTPDGLPMIGLSLDPPWRLEVEGVIAATSADLPWEQEDDESDEAYRARFDAACALSDALKGLVVREIEYVESTGDLTITFERGHLVRTFTVWRDEESWRVLDYMLKQRVLVWPEEVRVEALEPPSSAS